MHHGQMPAAARRDPTHTFLASMPERYRGLFDDAAALEHAGIVERRGDRPVHAELWRRLPRGRAVACVVAADRPGLLSYIAAALVVHGLDVEAAQAFTRETTGEAVDLFWLRREGAVTSPVLDVDIARVSSLLGDLVSGRTTIDAITSRSRPKAPPAPAAATTVTFEENDDGGVSVLTVETFDRPGLLLAVTRALHRARVQIIASEATSERGRVVDRFHIVEMDGAPLRPSRRGRLQVEVLAAIDALWHG
jgi:[protein-PII] uridylyltransferase